MKDKITSILRHFFTGAAAIAVDAGLIGQDDADNIVRLTAAAAAIIVSRLIIWALGKINFSQFFPGMGNKVGLFLVGTISMAAGFGSLSSCAPTQGAPRFKGSIFYKDPNSGAKAGLEYKDGLLNPWAKLPYIDKDGNVIGEFEIESAK